MENWIRKLLIYLSNRGNGMSKTTLVVDAANGSHFRPKEFKAQRFHN